MAISSYQLKSDKESFIAKLAKILEENKDKRIVVVGTTCTGKSTFTDNIEEAYDMDDLVFPKLSKKESDYVCQTPWTEEIGRTMTKLAKDRVKVEPGKPVFGTVVLDSDLIIELNISNNLLRERTLLRDVDFEDAKNMQRQIEEEIRNSKIPMIKFNVG
jgi:adenylate kinase